MKVLFISLERIDTIENHGIFTDLLREIKNNGHELTVLTALEKRNQTSIASHFKDEDGIRYIYANTGNITKNKRLIDKGIAVVLAGAQYKIAAKKYARLNYDLVICATPLITFQNVVRYVKRRDQCKSVLLLKDIWPYDLLFDGVLSKKGFKGIVYKYFDIIARKLFACSDVIGCMTPKNREFLEAVYTEGNKLDKAIIIPNSIEPTDKVIIEEESNEIRKNYDIPNDKIVFIYGGNLGTAQGPHFIVETIKAVSDLNQVFFVIVGSGTEESYIRDGVKNLNNVKLIRSLPYDIYNDLVRACDVGLVYLNWNCHTPNCPSRILQYMDASIPVICAIDDTTDIGQIVVKNNFGASCSSNDAKAFKEAVEMLLSAEKRKIMGNAAKGYLVNEWSAKKGYELIFENELIKDID